MVKVNRRAYDENQENFAAALENTDDESFDVLLDMVAEEKRRRGYDDEQSDWSADYRKARDARRRARDTETNPNVAEHEEEQRFPDDDEGEDAGRPMRRVKSDRTMDSQRAYDGRYSSDARQNMRAHLAVDALKADLDIRSRAPGVALDASGEFTKRFPNSARLRPNHRLRDLWHVKDPSGAA